jgi:hypothetical protein
VSIYYSIVLLMSIGCWSTKELIHGMWILCPSLQTFHYKCSKFKTQFSWEMTGPSGKPSGWGHDIEWIHFWLWFMYSWCLIEGTQLNMSSSTSPRFQQDLVCGYSITCKQKSVNNAVSTQVVWSSEWGMAELCKHGGLQVRYWLFMQRSLVSY